MKEKRIQAIINIITVFNIIIIILLGYYFIINNKYSSKYIKELSEKCNEYNNYVIETEVEDLETGDINKYNIIQKGDIRKEIHDGEAIWITKDILIYEKDKQYRKYKTEYPIGSLADEVKWHNYTNYNKYKYEKYNNTNCIVVWFKDIETAVSWNREEQKVENYKKSYKLWIDEKSGCILKEEEYEKEENENEDEYEYEYGKLVRITKYKVQINCVTDEEVKLPDLKEYKLVDADTI